MKTNKNKEEVTKMKGFTNIIYLFVGLTLAIILVANVVIPTIVGVDTSGWASFTGLTQIWGILPIVIVAGLLLMVMSR